MRASVPIHSTAAPDTTLLAASDRLENAIKYCTKVRKAGAAGKESNTSADACPSFNLKRGWIDSQIFCE